MKKLLSISYTTASFNIALLILRVGAGILLIPHGYQKLVGFQRIRSEFVSFMGLSPTISLSLSIFAEFFCSILVICGLLTRLAVIPILINMAVIIIMVNNLNFFGKGESASLFFLAFTTVLLLGPGKVSADGLMNK